jgi:hypothetical protein
MESPRRSGNKVWFLLELPPNLNNTIDVEQRRISEALSPTSSSFSSTLATTMKPLAYFREEVVDEH